MLEVSLYKNLNSVYFEGILFSHEYFHPLRHAAGGAVG
jgi:hypothetical protein